MASTKDDAPSTQLEAAPTAQTEQIADAEAPVAAAPAKKTVRRTVLIAVGALVAAALVFGGGVAVGLAIPSGGPGFSQQGGPGGSGGFPGGSGQNGDRPQMPGNGQQRGPGSTDDSGSGSDSGSTDDSGSTGGSTDDGA